MNAKEKLAAAIKAARDIAVKVKSENRNFTPEEQADLDAKMAEIDGLKAHIAAGEKSAGTLAALDAMASGREMTLNEQGDLVADNGGLASFAPPLKGARCLSFGKSMTADLTNKIRPNTGEKALAPSGATVTGQTFEQSPIVMEQVTNSLLAALPTTARSERSWRYLQQTTRTNNAAVVAEGAVKPTSVYGLVEAENALSIVAHLSEAINRYWLSDNSTLQGFVESELVYGLQRAIEAKVLADINAVGGIQTQVYSTSVLQTLRKTLTKLQSLNYNAEFFLLHPNDFEGIELALSTVTAVEYRGLPFDPVARRLYGVPIVLSVDQAQGVSHTVAQGAVTVDHDTQGVQMQWSETSNADDWSKNLIRARCETRVATTVYRPLGVVKGDLTA